ncbi:RHS repeat-associated core domain-containing protein [Chryseobacterium salviniae]|uniref:RHS repeat-associated core domain-containing protein n=1 Tax=Chryseobacterium salviniae TaxID=3101750 RepID=A0ABU6HR03_9FLAO|nr:RHS repeat-associated core domain-containing protein [Chryseobacterium sp. T9W2-O]MEC3875491.1 RHS repeat-associated core domain-containing protein [Chryseobacterium sp. T9W2-O]
MADQNKIKKIKVAKPDMNPDRSWKINADVTSFSKEKTTQGWKSGMKNNFESLNPASMIKSVAGDEAGKSQTGGGGGGTTSVTAENATPTSKVKLIKVNSPAITPTAVQHTSKHFDIVLAIDIHWTLIPPPPSFMLIPLPLPHPFIGIVFDVMDYIKFTIPVPQFIRNLKPDLPETIPMGGSIYVHGRHKATTTTSVMGVVIPFRHITSLIPVYMIPFLQEAPHEGEVYYGAQTVLGQGSKMSGNQPQQVLTCMGFPFGITMLPAMPNKPKKNPLAYFAFYNNFSSLYIQINTGGPVLVGGAFVPHVYTPGEMLMRFAGMALMRGLTKSLGKGVSKFNHFLQGKFGKNNPVSKALCKVGLEPVNFASGAMLFEWDDFTIEAGTPLEWTNIWYSDRPYQQGMLGNGMFNSHDLYIVPDEEDNVAAWVHPEELQPVPIPVPQVGEELTYYRSQKIWQYRPNENSWIIRKETNIYTYKRFNHSTEGSIFKVIQIEYGDGTIREYDYEGRNVVLKNIKDVKSGFAIETKIHPELKKITEVYYCYKNRKDLQVRYDYDQHGNLTHVWDIHKKAIVFEYDEKNRVIRRTNRNGMSYHWEYDKNDRVVHTKGSEGFMEGFLSYNEDEGYTEVIYPRQNNKTETYYYDEDLLVYKQVDGEGGETWYDYTAHNELKMTGTPEGRVQGYSYDEFGNITIFHTQDGEEFHYQYNEFGQITARFSPSGTSETWIYDEEGRLLRYTDPTDETIYYQYPDHGKLPENSIKKEIETRYEYNTRNQIIRLTNNAGDEQYWKYDDYGRLSIFSPRPLNKTVWNRDKMGRVVEVNEPGQLPLKLRYDAYDLPVYATDGRAEWLLSYTPMGSLKRQVRRNALTLKKEETLNFGYNAYENLMSITNEKGEVYRFERNKNDEIIGETGFDGQQKFFVRDKDGLVTQTRNPNGKNIFYAYDLGGRLTQVHYPDGTWEAYQYDTSGLLIKADNEHSSVSFQRNKLGLVTFEKQGAHSIDYQYDDQANLISLKSSLGAAVEYSYNDLGQLKSIQAATKDIHLPWQMNLNMSRNGQLFSRKMTGGIESTFEFDHAGMPVSQKVTVDKKKTAFHKEYHWAPGSRLLQILDRVTGGKTRFDYDAFGNLVAAEYPNGDIQYKNPDETGCLYESAKRTDRIYDKGGKLMRDKNWFYHYDEEGNVLLKSKRPINNIQSKLKKGKENNHPYYKTIAENWANIPKLRDENNVPDVTENAAGQPQNPEWQPGDWAYSWKANGMLAAVKLPDGKEIRFEYDALGRRISKIGNKKITRYIWDGNVLLHEWFYDINDEPKTSVDDDGNIIIEKEKAENVVTWVYDHTDQNELSPVAKLIGGTKYSILNNYLGTPVQAFDVEGNAVWNRTLDIYGNIKDESGEENFIPFLYQGQYYDPEINLCYNRFRYYDQHSGLYISQDPISLMGGLSFYTYVDDTNLLIDPFGLAPWPRGGFNDWFNNASVTDIVKNKSAVSRALRNGGGMHEMFPVCLAPKLKALGFTAEEIKNATVPTKGLVFKDVPDPKTGALLTGAHHKSAASKVFHDNLIGDLSKAKSKIAAKRISKRHHAKHVKVKKVYK